jgi:uncharacterized protein (DUF1330 family)
MAKGYWVANIDVSDMDGYKQYVAANAVPFRKYSAKFLIRGGKSEAVEGKLRSRVVVIEFPSYQAALDCYHSPEYAHAKTFRDGKAVGEIIVLEGYDGPQPSDG